MPKLARVVAGLLIFAVAASAQTPAQDWNNVKAIAAGTVVRVKMNSRDVRGQLQGVTDDRLTVDSENGPAMFSRQEILRVSVKKKGHRLRNTLIGLGAGVAGGAVIGAASHKDCTGFCILYTTRAQDAGIGAALGAIVGTAVGALIPTGGWREVYHP
jgi:hypothetical protein